MALTKDEIVLLLEALRRQYGTGYSDAPGVGALQAKLSVMLEVRQRQEEAAGAAGGPGRQE